MKKRLIYISLIIICLLFIVYFYFFLTKENKNDNIITFGNIKMQIIETKLDSNDREVSVKNYEELDVSSTPNLDRIIRVKNLGKESIYIRLSFDLVRLDENNKSYDVTDDMISVNINNDNWILKDNKYYYKYQLKEGQTTKKLVAQIKFNLSQLMKKYPNGRFDLKINAQAVQVKNNKKDILEVEGWPSEE